MTFYALLRSLAATSACALALVGCHTLPASTQNPPSSSGASASPQEDAPKDKDVREEQVVGKPAPNSKFNKLKIGMGMKEVTDLIGPPSDQGAYITGKAWIPFYFGPDRYRHELLYKGQGRLVFAGGSVGDLSSGRLSRIIHNADERGYR